ncbi:hypothetical protein ABZV58_02370 [Nocardia sp. NPDC004654]|uniref:hypothetical protein n=1 Tax=Nocardia sp. NPDC004654 TaxID=3154776 RepID=UPI0033AFF6BF
MLYWMVLAGAVVGGGIWAAQTWFARTGRSQRLNERQETSRVVRSGRLPENWSVWVPRLQAYRRGYVVWGRFALALAALYALGATSHLLEHDNAKAALFGGLVALFLASAYVARRQVRGTDKLLHQ